MELEKIEALPSWSEQSNINSAQSSGEALQSQTNANESAEEENLPLGRLKAWSTVLGCFLLTFCAGGPPASFGVFQDFYAENRLKDFSPSDISWIGSVQLFLELGLAPVAGKLFDAGHFRLLIAIGSVLISLSYCMLSLTEQNQYFQVFLSQGIAMGIGIGLLYLPASTVVSKHFKDRKALVMGIVSSSTPAGGVVYSIVLNKLIRSSIGFAWGVRYVGFSTIACLLLANFMVFDPSHKAISSTQSAKKDRESSSLFGPGIWDLPFILVLICAFLLNFGTYFPVFYVQLYAVSHGVDSSLAFYSVAILNASNVLGRVLPNYVADRLGPMNVFIVCLALNGAFTFAMFASGTAVGLITFAIIYGFSLGGTISLYLPMVGSLSKEKGNVGRRMGISLAPVGLACLIGAPISGATLGSHRAWWKGITLAGVTMLASSAFLIGIALMIRRRSS